MTSTTEAKDRHLSRREFLKGTVAASICATASLAYPMNLSASAEQNSRSRVICIRDDSVYNSEGKIDSDVLSRMLDTAVAALFSSENPREAWKIVIKPEDTVGIKSNVWRFLPTPPELNAVLERCVRGCGVSEDRISVDDRGVLSNPVFQKATALINVRPARTHYWAGVGSLLKNYIMFVPDPPAWHADSCADLGKIWLLPQLKNKTRLVVLSVLTVQFHGRGPHHYDPRYIFRYNGLLVGTDPVAVDTIGLQLIKAKRKEHFGEERDLETIPHHILYADTRHGLGTSNRERIDLIRLGSQINALI